MPQPWFISYRPPAHPASRLFCIPFAGGGASAFRSWQPLLPLEVELLAVQAPGREGRFREAPLRDIDTLLEQLGPALARQLDRPYAIFGHSLGALVAFELTRWLRRHGLPLPHRLFLSGRRAASMPLDRKPYHDLPDDELLDEIGRMGGTDASMLQNRELMEMLLPTMRADFAIHETYRYRPEPPLPVPFSVFGGRDDFTTPAASLAGWAGHTSAGAEVRMFEGGHFFIQQAREAVLDAVRAAMSELLLPARAPFATA